MVLERAVGTLQLLDVLDRVLDKGIVIDAWVRVSLLGIELITVETRVFTASIETYLKYAGAVALVPSVSRPASGDRSLASDVEVRRPRIPHLAPRFHSPARTPRNALVRGETKNVIASEIAKQIRQYPRYSIFDDVEGSVHDGIVVLTGKVTAPYKAPEIADRVSRVPGVREVANKIQTLPVSTFDDELRTKIASQIYRDPSFWNYAIQVNPPIHIIVEHGRVTLKGVVGSEVDRRKVEMIARTTPNVFDVKNKLQVETGSDS